MKHFLFYQEFSQKYYKCGWVFVSCSRYSCRILTELEFSRQTFERYSNMKCRENSPIWSRVVPCGRTDRLDEANSRFCRLANAPKNSTMIPRI